MALKERRGGGEARNLEIRLDLSAPDLLRPISDIGNVNLSQRYRDRLKGLYVVARNFFMLLLNCSAWPCLAVA